MIELFSTAIHDDSLMAQRWWWHIVALITCQACRRTLTFFWHVSKPMPISNWRLSKEICVKQRSPHGASLIAIISKYPTDAVYHSVNPHLIRIIFRRLVKQKSKEFSDEWWRMKIYIYSQNVTCFKLFELVKKRRVVQFIDKFWNF